MEIYYDQIHKLTLQYKKIYIILKSVSNAQLCLVRNILFMFIIFITLSSNFAFAQSLKERFDGELFSLKGNTILLLYKMNFHEFVITEETELLDGCDKKISIGDFKEGDHLVLIREYRKQSVPVVLIKKADNCQTKKTFKPVDNQEVYKAQLKLQKLGYDPGVPDGLLGQKTKTTLKKFQKDHGLSVTGHFDDKTKEKLNEVKP
jgi:hypothetical protein